MAPRKPRKKAMSDEHLDALARGRTEGAIVRRYLVALESHKPKRGRKRTPESMKKRLTDIETQLKKTDPLTRVQLVQERMDLRHQLESSQNAIDMEALEKDFIEVARAYGDRKGLTYSAWREVGIDAAILRKAGIRRTSNG